jgi:hypothetical protein
MIVSLTPDPHPTMLSDGTTNIVYGIGNERLHAVTAGVATWFTHDHLGSTRQTVTSSGTVAGSVLLPPDPRSLTPDRTAGRAGTR